MNPRPELRIGDAEREAAVTALGEHYAAGRLTKDEYDERAAIAWTAKTNSALWPLFADLPRPQAGPPPTPVPAPPRRRQRDHGGPWLGAVMMPVLVVLVALAITKHLPVLILVGIFWLLWAKTSSQARRDARRRQWDDRWGRR